MKVSFDQRIDGSNRPALFIESYCRLAEGVVKSHNMAQRRVKPNLIYVYMRVDSL